MDHTPQPDDNTPPARDSRASVAARRRVILQGLGKGGAALAVLSPVASQASRTHKLANSALPAPSFGYCTVSGFQSAAISGNPAPLICGAFAPGHFVSAAALTYTGGNIGIVGTVDATKLATALNTKYAVTVFTASNVAPLLSTTAPLTVLAVPDSGVVLQWISSNRSRALKPKNPVASVNMLGAFNSLFPSSTDARPLLQVLYDGVASATPSSGNCYFLAAYLSAGLSGVTLPADFNRAYVVSRYTSASYGAATNEYKFFQALCQAA